MLCTLALKISPLLGAIQVGAHLLSIHVHGCLPLATKSDHLPCPPLPAASVLKIEAVTRGNLRRPLPQSAARGATGSSGTDSGGASGLQMLWSGGRRTKGNEVRACRSSAFRRVGVDQVVGVEMPWTSTMGEPRNYVTRVILLRKTTRCGSRLYTSLAMAFVGMSQRSSEIGSLRSRAVCSTSIIAKIVSNVVGVTCFRPHHRHDSEKEMCRG